MFNKHRIYVEEVSDDTEGIKAAEVSVAARKKISCFPGNYLGRTETGRGGGRRAASKQQLLA